MSVFFVGVCSVTWRIIFFVYSWGVMKDVFPTNGRNENSEKRNPFRYKVLGAMKVGGRVRGG